MTASGEARTPARRREARKSGLMPGTLVHVGAERVSAVGINLIHFTAEHAEDVQVPTAEACFPYRDAEGVTWINVDGVHDVGVVERLGLHFGLHPLALEDIVNTNQRPKVEDFESYVYFVVRMLSARNDGDGMRVDNEQISIVLGHNFVLTFQERPGDAFEPVRQRIRENRGRIRKLGADYLAYSLMDVVVDNYFVVLEQFGEEVEEVEQSLMDQPSQELLQDIQRMKRLMIEVRRAVWPLRDVINAVLRGDVKLFKKPTLVFLRDVYDHCVRVVDITETHREMVASMLEIYVSQMSHRMNEVMKVLTIIATIFIPLTFVAGVYGMNFDNMPELHWDLGYGFAWGIMVAVSVTLIVFFKKRNWF